LDAVAGRVAAIKPNAAFFEQFGGPGYDALISLSAYAKQLGIPMILDAKRGDIGSTAQAYANAYFHPLSFLGEPIPKAECDALTLNPFLGFDTLAPFLAACRDSGKGVFLLVKTSNPGSSDIQNLQLHDSTRTVLDTVANFVAKEGHTFLGTCGLSSLGAVVGATYPGEAANLRAAMPNAIFLVPGFGAQGGSAKSAVSGFTPSGRGGIVNMSRGIFSLSNKLSITDWITEVHQRCDSANHELQLALSHHVTQHSPDGKQLPLGT
jgi:orotidine-5'-phosphate decarboxylase